MTKRYKAKIKAEAEMIVWITEDVYGNQEIEEIEEVLEIDDYDIKNLID